MPNESLLPESGLVDDLFTQETYWVYRGSQGLAIFPHQGSGAPTLVVSETEAALLQGLPLPNDEGSPISPVHPAETTREEIIQWLCNAPVTIVILVKEDGRMVALTLQAEIPPGSGNPLGGGVVGEA